VSIAIGGVGDLCYGRVVSITDASVRCDGWAFEPEALERVLPGVDGGRVFSALQRPWRWQAGRPLLAARVGADLLKQGLALPTVVRTRSSSDGSRKLLVAMPSGGSVEVVHMPRAVGAERTTLCVSSQIGCALGCAFCATATLGLERQLSAGEIVTQVLLALHAHGPRHPGELTLVFMGMGEPLHNLPNVAQAIRVLTHPRGLGLSPRRITVSTAGLVRELAALAELERRPLLAVSLNATTDELRSELMPINRRYPLETLRAALVAYPCRPRERITVEYVLLGGVNDGPGDAARLADFCAPFPHHVNVIPWNAHPGSRFRAPTEAELDAFVAALLRRRPTLVTVRRSRGRDIEAACGQLARLSPRTELVRPLISTGTA
jgi:23S rRNA (adenine2503-C2)-methyltransferase